MKKQIVMLGTSFATQGGISAVVKVYREAGLLDKLAVRYLETHRDGSKWRKLSYFLRAWWQFAWLLLSMQIRLIHVHHASHASFWRKLCFILPAFLFRVPVIIHLHGGGFAKFYGEESSPRVQALIRYVYNHAAAVVVLSKTWLDWVRTISSNPRVMAVYNPVAVPALVPFAQREPATILFLGKIGENKGCYDLLQAAKVLQAEFPLLKICMAGDGEQARARDLGDQLGLGACLELPGWTNGEQKHQLLQRASIYALPSYFEGLPMSILEAMAYGLPVVSTPIGGIPEAVQDGVTGLLHPARDVEALTQALRRLLQDSALREKMGALARKKIEQSFSTQCILPQLEELYARIDQQNGVQK